MPQITFITTTYKHEKFIAFTIDSIIAQNLDDWELLIGDDSPDEKTWEIIQKYIQKYPQNIKAWRHIPNKGIVDNMNFLLEKRDINFDFIVFLEGDDMITANYIQKKLEIFQKYPQVQLVYNDLSFMNSKNEIILESFFQQRSIKIYQNQIIPKNDFLLAPAGPIASWSTSMIRAEILEKYQIQKQWEDKKYSIADYEFYFDIATENKVYGISESLTLYRRHGGNLSGANGGTSGDLEKWFDLKFQKGEIDKKVYRLKKSWTNIVSAIFSLEVGDKKSARIYFLNSIKYNVLYKFHYKIALFIFLILPKNLTKKILGSLIKRGN